MPTLDDADLGRIHDIVTAAVAPIANDVERHNRILDGNGQPGLVTRVASLEAFTPKTSWRDRVSNGGISSIVAAIVAGVVSGIGVHR